MDSDKTSLASTLQSFLNSQPLLCTDLEHSTYPKIIAPSIFEENFLFNSVYYISDIHLDNHILQQSTLTPTQYTEKVIDGLFTDNFINSINMPYPPIVLFGGDIASTFETAKLFYTEFVSRISQVKLRNFANLPYIYAILGNHELWDFPNLKDCYTAYQALFDSLNIHFLHNTTSPLGHHYHLPSAKSASSTTNSKRMPTDTIHSTIIVGGIGFAGHNETYNADCGLYRSTLNRCQEIKETQKWCKSYSKALTLAHNTGSRLIVLTHNPIVDWKDNSQPDPNCIYFNGHTHKNNLMHDEKLDIHIFADNQIGYQNPNISFKIAQIYKRCNPFSTYIDGYYEISVSDYLRFYDYIGELISGIRTIENYMKNGANFYMIKRNDYYGFFVISSKASYVCAGGRIKKTSKHLTIQEFDSIFSDMVNTYLKILAPFRALQERIADQVKSFGGTGKIHGTIVDIDFFNHIMLNPQTNTITYYFSPMPGIIQSYNTMLELLNNHNPELAANYKALSGKSENTLLSTVQSSEADNITKISLKDSIYTFSNRLNQLQRLFDKKVLRDWDDDLITSKSSLQQQYL